MTPATSGVGVGNLERSETSSMFAGDVNFALRKLSIGTAIALWRSLDLLCISEKCNTAST